MKKRKLFLGLFAAVAALSLASCGEDNETTPTPEATPTPTVTPDATPTPELTPTPTPELTPTPTPELTPTPTPTPEVLDVYEELTAAYANASTIKGGTVVNNYDGTTNEYAFGENYFTYKNANYEYHYSLDENGNAFGIQKDSYSTNEVYSYNEYNVLGYELAPFSYGEKYYGPEDLALGLYEYLLDNEISVKESIEKSSNEGELYTINYNFETEYTNPYGTTYFYQTALDIIVGEGEYIKSLTIVAKYYAPEYDDNSGTFVPTWTVNNDGSVTINDGVEPYTAADCVFTQEVGTRDAVNEYTAEKLCFTSFELQDAEGNAVKNGDTRTISSGYANRLVLSIVNPVPETASADIDSLSLSYVNENGDESGLYCGTWSGYSIQGQTAGTYEVTIASQKYSITITVIVEVPAPTSIWFNQLQANSWGGYDSIEITETELTVYANSAIYLEAGVPSNTLPDYTMSFETATTDASLTQTELNGDTAYEFKSAVLGFYNLVVTSTADSNVVKTLTINVVEAPNGADILNGKYYYNYYGTMYNFEFKPESDGAANGTVELTGAVTNTLNYSYDSTINAITLTNTDGSTSDVTMAFDANFDITVSLINSYGYTMNMTLVEWSLNALLASQFTSDVTIETSWGEMPFQLSFNGDGTGYAMIGYGYPDFEYDITDNGDGTYNVTITPVSGDSFIKDNTAVLNADGSISATVIYDSVEYVAVFTE